jgi:hypothetical protein
LLVKQWIEKNNAIGITAKAGRCGGACAQIAIQQMSVLQEVENGKLRK